MCLGSRGGSLGSFVLTLVFILVSFHEKCTASRTDFPTTICHSPQDNIVTFNNVPVFPFSNEMVVPYSPPLAFLTPTGTHLGALVLCALSPILAITQITTNGPILIAALENPPATCGAGTMVTQEPGASGPTSPAVPGTNPTLAPGGAPTQASGAPQSALTVLFGLFFASMFLVVAF
jgi:hypothetical protein